MQGYQLKIIIKNSKPPIWRRVVVPGEFTFGQLHETIQDVYGWEGQKPYFFENPQNKKDPGISGNEKIDTRMESLKWIRYTYGDAREWELRIEIEKTVDYGQRYPLVQKYKGDNLPEHCGGIKEYDKSPDIYETETSGFRIDAVNEKFREQLLLEEERPVSASVEENETNRALKDWLGLAHQEELADIARMNHLAAHQNLTRKELEQRLAELLLNETHLTQVLLYAKKDEFKVFEELLECGEGEGIDLGFFYRSKLLRSYGWLVRDNVVMLPREIRQLGKQVITSGFREQKNEIWMFQEYCNSMNYLYGVTPVSLFARLYNQYEHTSLSEAAIRQKCVDLMTNQGPVAVIGDNLVSSELLEQDAYRMLLLLQGNKPFYIPAVRGIFLQYGKMYGEAPDKFGVELMRYVQDEMNAGQAQAASYFYEVQALIHKNYELNDLIAAASKYNISIQDQIQMAGLTTRLRNLWNHTRRLGDRGHTPLEIEEIQKKAVPGKAAPTQRNQKIYPNDPCPCGSGKKYKKCCGR